MPTRRGNAYHGRVPTRLMASSAPDPATLVRRLQEEVWNEGDLDRVEAYLTEEFVQHNPTEPREVRGRDAYREYVESFLAAFPDLEETVESVTVDGDTVAHRFTMRGTHEGTLADIEATGREVTVDGMIFSRIERGKVAERWVSYDTLGLLRQLGVVQARPAREMEV